VRRLLPAIAALLVVGTAGAAATLQPPDLTLRSKAGVQAGVQGSYCVRDATQGICGDTGPPHPTRLNVVRPGGRLTLRVSEGTLSSPSASLGLLGCNGSLSTRAVARRNGVWQITAPARPGAYELLVFARFSTDTTSGDTSEGFGVLVSRSKARRIVPAAPYAVC
jgi:hypothetical protein